MRRKGFAKCLLALLAAALLLYACTPPGDSVSTPPKWVRVAAGGSHTLAINENGHLYAWGNNNRGQIGNGENGASSLDKTKNKKTPQRIGTDADWQAIAAGYDFSLALKKDGTLYAWGANDSGQLGDGSTTNRNAPVKIGSDTNWKNIIAGGAHSLALKSDGTLYVWGTNASGQLGNGIRTGELKAPTKISSDTDWTAIGAGNAHSLALKSNGSFYAWGGNNFGQLGDGTNTARTAPTKIGSDTDWKAIDGGLSQSLAIKRGGTLYLWGANGAKSPRKQGSAANWAAIGLGINHFLALTTTGELYAQGGNGNGQLGDGTTAPRNALTKIGADTDWAAIDVNATGSYSLGLKKDGTLYAWGANDSGQLGDGSTTSKKSPTLIAHP